MRKSLLLSGFITLLVLGSFGSWILLPLPQETSTPTWTFYDRRGELLFTQSIVPPSNTELPKAFKQRLIAQEDQYFYDHHGVNIFALGRAFRQNAQEKRIVSGASTITMQLARLKYLPNVERDYWYKIKQIAYALKLEWHLEKEEILDQYIKRIAFGNGTQGIDQAAKRYFSKAPNQLSIGEQAMLIGLMPNPSQFNPISHPQKAENRKSKVLQTLKKKNLINEEDYRFWNKKIVKVTPQVNNSITAPHFVFWAKDQLQSLPSFDTSKLGNLKEIHVHTTLDKKLYEDLRHIAHQEITQTLQDKNLHSSSIVALNNTTGNIVAMIGSINFFDQKRDGAVNMAIVPRQSGSTLKPFLYALALEKGWSPLDEIIDEPLGYKTEKGQYNPRNFNVDHFYGRVRMREALANSYNLSAVYLLNQIGVEAFNTILTKLDLDIGLYDQQLGLGSILGSGEVSLLHLTNAYRTFTQKGWQGSLNWIIKVTDQDGNPIPLENKNSKAYEPIFSHSTSDWVTHALSDEEARWKLFGQKNALEINRPAASKTGTSQEFKDNWVIGYTPQYTVGVWVGNPDSSPLHTSSGIEGAGPIWNKVMRRIHHQKLELPFYYESSRSPQSVCRRPYQSMPDCSERVQAFITDQEKNRQTITQRPPLKISFPSDGDIFHPNTELLLKVINNAEPKVEFYLNGSVTQAHIKRLAPGSHEIWAQSGNQTSQPITIYVD